MTVEDVPLQGFVVDGRVQTIPRSLADSLTPRQLEFLRATLNYHLLVTPHDAFRLRIALGNEHQLPITTWDGAHAPVPFLEAAEELPTLDVRGSTPAAAPDRFALISRDEVTPSSPTGLRGRYWAARSRAERLFPLQYDLARQLLLAGRQRRLERGILAEVPNLVSDEIRTAIARAPSGSRPAAIIAMHWLELGGAETWAVETVRLVQEAGLLPIIITDRDSQHPLIADELFRDALVLPLTFGSERAEPHAELLPRLFEEFDVRGLWIHHSAWIYAHLPTIKALHPELPVIDSLHIVEYAGGGYPTASVQRQAYIDTHHVISPQLERWLVDVAGVPERKTVMAPLVGLTADASATAIFAPRSDEQTFTIAFVGRFVRQKRPYLFIQLIQRLIRSGVRVRAIMQGSGELEDLVRKQVAKGGLESVIEVREHGRPVRGTFEEADLLVVSSQNEGLTLTTLEALAAGVPVLSADVGSQSTLIPSRALVPRAPASFLRESVRRIRLLSGSETERESLWTEEYRRAVELSSHRSATEWARERIAQWART